jgi:hypothetical protein
LTQIDEYKDKEIYNLGNQEKLNDIYLKKVKSSNNLINLQNYIPQSHESPKKTQTKLQPGSKKPYEESNIKIKEIEREREIITENNNYSQLHNQNMSSYREGRSVYLNFGRLCDERERDDGSKSPRLINTNYINQNNITNICQNKIVIRNIETNVNKIFN